MTLASPTTTVLFFARARELAGVRSAELSGHTVAEVLAEVRTRFGAELGELCATCTIVVDGEMVPAAGFDTTAAGHELAVLPPVSGGAVEHEHHRTGPRRLRIAVLTVSDRASVGDYEDRTGPAVARAAERLLDADIVELRVVADDSDAITDVVAGWCDRDVCDVVLTAGGTGLSPRDVTPEATRRLLHVEAPGLAELMRAEGLRHRAMAALSRQVAGRRGRTVVLNLAGSPTAATENLEAVAAVLPHAVAMARSGT
ncbi:MAG: molybdopterin-binding protein [Ilumatobacteraceae bacterium]|nr:molybdopterin-binding protein [Ilumatobacteraceae bacterium]